MRHYFHIRKLLYLKRFHCEQNPWPRTTTERMLSEAFQGRSAQLLAVIEALTDSKRRIAQTSLGAPESDDSILDVFAELFFAGCELIAGGGGTRAPSPGKHESVITDNIEDVQLIDMAVKGKGFKVYLKNYRQGPGSFKGFVREICNIFPIELNLFSMYKC